MEFKSKKTAIEMLEEISNKQDQILSYLKNINFTQKILLSKYQNTETKEPLAVAKEPSKEKYKFEDLPRTNKFNAMLASAGIIEETDGFKIEQSNVPVPRKRQNPVNESTSFQAVRQKIVTNRNEPIFLAFVEFKDFEGNVIKKTRTDNNGAWKASLSPGQYTVSVVKRDNPTSGKKGFSIEYNISIDRQDGILELENKIISVG